MDLNSKITLIVHDSGDSTVGIPGVYWELQCPFNRCTATEQEIEDFRDDAETMYAPFCEGKIQVYYSDEKQD